MHVEQGIAVGIVEADLFDIGVLQDRRNDRADQLGIAGIDAVFGRGRQLPGDEFAMALHRVVDVAELGVNEIA